MKPAKEDETALLRAAQKRFQREVSIEHIGYDSNQGHVWVVRDGTESWVARGWFGANGNPYFREFKDT